MAGKGDKARNCHSKKYRDNFNLIEWTSEKAKKKKKTSCTSKGKIIQYYK